MRWWAGGCTNSASSTQWASWNTTAITKPVTNTITPYPISVGTTPAKNIGSTMKSAM